VDRATLLTLSRDDLIALIEAQAGQIAALVKAHAQQIATLTARITALEAKLALPPKNPDNSSLSRITLSDVLLTSELDGLPSSASRRL